MTGVKVLLIEAKKVNTRSYSVDLLKSNHIVQVENSASKAVDNIRKFAPDIIVLDAASISITSRFRSPLIEMHDSHFPHGS